MSAIANDKRNMYLANEGIYICLCIHVNMYKYTTLYINIHKCIHVFMYKGICIYTHTHILIYTYTCLNVGKGEEIYIYICIYVYSHICIYVFICIHRYIYIYIYTCTGLIVGKGEESAGMSEDDRSKRQKAQSEKRKKLLNPLFFVSAHRYKYVCSHNLACMYINIYICMPTQIYMYTKCAE
jgi:hypothetical protein